MGGASLQPCTGFKPVPRGMAVLAMLEISKLYSRG